ncbi:MAG: tRNA (guanosine(46)-N7)-methyltransferase TrmB [Erysipelotrichaceae bacterium]|nr:tRNA (guanosine(46)-N7)-methyltransferase TrmB [Erysipelotrichaceae bacterium]
MRGRAKPWAIPYLQEHPELVYPQIEENDPFLSVSPLYLEIGMGKGDFLIGISRLQEGHYLGLERDRSVLATAAKKIEGLNLDNVRLIAEDFDKVYESLKAYRFDKIYLNFSDPWPKKRHAKRRLTYHERLALIASLLKEGGEIVMKTDNASLYAFTLDEVPLAKLCVKECTDQYVFDPEHDAMSEYEARFRSLGQNIHRIIIVK